MKVAKVIIFSLSVMLVKWQLHKTSKSWQTLFAAVDLEQWLLKNEILPKYMADAHLNKRFLSPVQRNFHTPINS